MNTKKRNAFHSKWLIPLILAGFALLLWMLWYTIDPRLLAINYIASGTPPHTYTFGVNTLDLFEGLHDSLLIVVFISIGCAFLSMLAAWLKHRYAPAILVFSITAIIYSFSAVMVIREQSSAPHYVYLANAFLHGHTALERQPPDSEENDWTYHEGKWYVSFPPAPALLMLPFVAVWGLDFNDVIFTLLIGALNAAILYQLLPYVGKRLNYPIQISQAARIGLTITFAFGTVHWWLAVNGQVWFTAQIVATFFLLLALLETFSKSRSIWIAFFLGMAALARPPILFALPALIWLIRSTHTWKEISKGLIPLGIIGIGMGFYNYARFGNPIDLGYQYMRLEDILAAKLAQNGSFNFIYLKENFFQAFLNLPGIRIRFPFLVMDGWGMSIFLSTPILIYAFFAPWKEKLPKVLLLAAVLVAIPNLLYYNTGYLQAGYRYALDFLPFLLILVLLGMRGKLTLLSGMLITLSIITGFLSVANFFYLYNDLFLELL